MAALPVEEGNAVEDAVMADAGDEGGKSGVETPVDGRPAGTATPVGTQAASAGAGAGAGGSGAGKKKKKKGKK